MNSSDIWQDWHAVQEMRHENAILRWRGLLEVAITNAEDIAAGRATELEARLLEIIEESKAEDPRMNSKNSEMPKCKCCGIVMEINWTAESSTAGSVSYTQSVTVKQLFEIKKDLEWMEYEVAPEWEKFCSFGPEDIGTVWEEIGAIRKRPQFDMLVMSESMLHSIQKAADRVNASVEHQALYGIPVLQSCIDAIYGVRRSQLSAFEMDIRNC